MIEELEKQLNKKDLLKFASYTGSEPDVESFLKKFTEINKRYFTKFVDGNKQCEPNKYRSIEDIYLLTRNYFPKTTLKEVMKILAELVTMDKLFVIWCPRIKKRVFMQYRDINAGLAYTELKMYGAYNGTEKGKDEFGFNEDDYLNLLK